MSEMTTDSVAADDRASESAVRPLWARLFPVLRSPIMFVLWSCGMFLLIVNGFIQQPVLITSAAMVMVMCAIAMFCLPLLRSDRWDGWRHVAALALALFATIASWLSADWLSNVLKHQSIARYDADIEAYKASAHGYRFLKALAAENHVQFEVSDARGGWAPTTILTPYTSPASTEVSAAYCAINLNKNSLLSILSPPQRGDVESWFEGLQAHELAHCVDMIRDEPRATDSIKGTFPSIAPQDAGGVHDLSSYLTASRTDSTAVWREAVADIYAVGFWRLSYPSAATANVKQLKYLRQKGKTDDPLHETGCFIDRAAVQPMPIGMTRAQLFGWAEAIRTAANCSLPTRHHPV